MARHLVFTCERRKTNTFIVPFPFFGLWTDVKYGVLHKSNLKTISMRCPDESLNDQVRKSLNQSTRVLMSRELLTFFKEISDNRLSEPLPLTFHRWSRSEINDKPGRLPFRLLISWVHWSLGFFTYIHKLKQVNNR